MLCVYNFEIYLFSPDQVSKVGSQYLRVCDSIKYAIGRISDIQRLHGVKKIYTNPLVCDGDGAYGAYNVTSGM